MEITEGRQGVVAKKVWNIVRALMFMLRKGIAKSKVVLELKRGKLGGKAFITNLIMQHQHLTCRSRDTATSITDYEFSCSNSPAIMMRRPHGRHNNNNKTYLSQYDDVSTLSAVQKVLEILNNQNSKEAVASPLVALPGFGKSPVGIRQLRVTDSPFPLKDDDADSTQVDVAAEEFIKRFYKDLNLQKRFAIDSPYHASFCHI